MDWITGIQNAINYIEDHITEELDYEEIAKESFSSAFHFQRVFSILCGYTLGEYIRNRRLTLAGTELANTREKVIDVAYKYGYDNPESFAKAFQKFHGITPSQARGNGVVLKSFSRLSIKVTLEGGSIMNYRIEQKKPLVLFGYKAHFTGSPKERQLQDHNFICGTRLKHAVLQYEAHDADTTYNVINNIGDDGYDFYVAAYLGAEGQQDLIDTFGEEIAYGFYVILHPFDGFWDLKHEKRGSVRASIFFVAITILTFFYQSIGQGYLLNPEGEFSSIWVQIVGVIVPLLLFVVANWCLTTLFDGEGSFKDIFIACSYSLVPIPLLVIPTTILSNVCTNSEINIIGFISTLSFIWLGLLIVFGTQVTHDYTMGKNIITIAGTLIGMVFIMFLVLLFSTLVGKMISLVTNIVTEIRYRV